MAPINGAPKSDPGSQLKLDIPTKKDYQEWSQPRAVLPRDFRLLGEGMNVHFLAIKSHLAEYAHLRTPGYKRYKFAGYLTDSGDLITLQYLDWKKGRAIFSDNPFHVYVSGQYNTFELEAYGDIKLYTFDGRFYRDTQGYLRSVAHRRLIMGIDDQPIYVHTHQPSINIRGEIHENDAISGTIKVVSFKSPEGLWTIDGTVYYQREPKKVVILTQSDYEIAQGFYEEANKHPGRFSSSLMKPVGQSNSNAIKKLIESQETMFKAVFD